MALKDEYFTISEAAQMVGVTRQTVSRWIKEGELFAEKIGREVVIRQDKLLQYKCSKVVERFGEALSMMAELWLRIEFEEYSSGDKFELSDISSDGVFQFNVIRKNGASDILKAKTRIELAKKGKRLLPRIKIEKVWKETNEGRTI